MRLALLALLPVMLAACGNERIDPEARMPTPYPEDSEPGATVSPTSNEYAVVSTDGSGIEGEWTSTRIDGNDSLVFTSATEEQIAGVGCKETGEDAQNGVLFHRFMAFDDVGDSISVYMSSGSKSYGPAGDNPVTITVAEDDPFAVMLASAQGDIRIVTGSGDVTVIPTTEEVREFVAECRGAYVYTPPVEEDEEDTESEE
ncbi:hypothetical protein WNY37_06585 [Henriciella sp. AS95]|uniref:hypothetical protein n=1 Tax=Henriciella sp. AS95 TaxID=3135782 RepID=UPI0031815C77